MCFQLLPHCWFFLQGWSYFHLKHFWLLMRMMRFAHGDWLHNFKSLRLIDEFWTCFEFIQIFQCSLIQLLLAIWNWCWLHLCSWQWWMHHCCTLVLMLMLLWCYRICGPAGTSNLWHCIHGWLFAQVKWRSSYWLWYYPVGPTQDVMLLLLLVTSHANFSSQVGRR